MHELKISLKGSSLALFLLFQALHLSIPAAEANEFLPADRFIDLRLDNSTGVTAGLYPPLRNITNPQYLLSIDGNPTRDLSLKEIQQALRGQTGTSTEIEIAYPNGDTAKFSLKREDVLSKQESPEFDPLRALDNPPLHMATGVPNLIESSAKNSDLVVKANCKKALKHFKLHPEQSLSVFFNCMLLNQSIGDFDEANENLKNALHTIKTSAPTSHSNFRERAVVQNLVALNQLENAEIICKSLLPPTPDKVPRLPASISVLETYSLIPSPSAREFCKLLALEIVSGEKQQVTSFQQDYFWLAQYLESIDQPEKAIATYSKLLPQLQKLNTDGSFYKAQALGYCLYSKARLEALVGNCVQAQKDLEGVISAFDELSAKQRTTQERISNYFPKEENIKTALECLRTSTPIPSPPPARGFSNQDAFVNQTLGNSFELKLPEASKCFLLIKNNQKKESLRLANDLLETYRLELIPQPRYLTRQNLFNNNMRIARAFADNGWVEESTKHLSSLKNAMLQQSHILTKGDIAWTMLSAEMIYNSSLSGSSPEWAMLDESNPENTPKRKSKLSRSNRLRILAMAFLNANDKRRANFFIDQAIKEFSDQQVGKDSNGRPYSRTDRKDILFFDAAQIYALQKDQNTADAFMKIALADCHLVDEATVFSVLGLADAYDSAGQTHKSINLLERASALPKSQSNSGVDVALCRRLAELYKTDGNPLKALKSIENALDLIKEEHFKIDESELAARLCEQLGLFEKAATYYYAAGHWHGSHTKSHREELLRKVLACSAKVKNCDKSLLSKTYLGLCEFEDSRNLAQGQILREKAIELMPDSDPEKPKQLSILAYVRGELFKQNGSSNVSDKLDHKLKAAELAEKNNLFDRNEYWINLAIAEAEAKHIDRAFEHAFKGIEAYDLNNLKLHKWEQLVPASLAARLDIAGSSKNADLVLQKAQKRIEDLGGVDCLAAQVQKAHYFRYLALTRRDYSKATTVLESLLRLDLNKGSYAPPNHDMIVCRGGGGPYPVESSLEVLNDIMDTALSIVDEKHQELAIVLMNKILEAEKRQFGPDDYRVALSLVRIGKFYYLKNNISESHEAYSQALKIMQLYESTMFAVGNVQPEYYAILRKLDKAKEIETLEAQKLQEQRDRQNGIYRPILTSPRKGL